MISRQELLNELEGKVAECQNDVACFRADTFAYGIFIAGADEDPMYDIEIQGAGVAAIKAAKAGEPLVDAVFKMPDIDLQTTTDIPGSDIEVFDGTIDSDGPEVRVLELMSRQDSISDMAYRVAQCAYVCAQQAEGTCPIFNPEG